MWLARPCGVRNSRLPQGGASMGFIHRRQPLPARHSSPIAVSRRQRKLVCFGASSNGQSLRHNAKVKRSHWQPHSRLQSQCRAL